METQRPKALTDYLLNMRKQEREIAELRKAREQLLHTKNPDPKLLKMIEDELKERQALPAS